MCSALTFQNNTYRRVFRGVLNTPLEMFLGKEKIATLEHTSEIDS